MEINTNKEDKKLSDLKKVVCNFEDSFEAINKFFTRAGLCDVFYEKKTGSKNFRIFQWLL